MREAIGWLTLQWHVASGAGQGAVPGSHGGSGFRAVRVLRCAVQQAKEEGRSSVGRKARERASVFLPCIEQHKYVRSMYKCRLL